MIGRPPKHSSQRQRRNTTTTKATLEAPPATKVPLPTRYAEWCTATVDRKTGCGLTGGRHNLAGFAEQEVEPHEFQPGEIAWHPATVRWWSTIWDSPMAGEWVDADIPDLVMLATLVDQYWRTQDVKVAAEIRYRNREFGLTPMARRSLQWEVAKVDQVQRRQPPKQPVADPRQTLRAVK